MHPLAMALSEAAGRTAHANDRKVSGMALGLHRQFPLVH